MILFWTPEYNFASADLKKNLDIDFLVQKINTCNIKEFGLIVNRTGLYSTDTVVLKETVIFVYIHIIFLIIKSKLIPYQTGSRNK